MITRFKHTPMELYQSALKEINSDDEITRRQGYEKGWLTTIKAIDVFLEHNNYQIDEGTPETNRKRNDALEQLSETNPIASEIQDQMYIVMGELHGRCFYEGIESPKCKRVLHYTVKDILEKTGTFEES